MRLGVIGVSWISDDFVKASLEEGYELVAVGSRTLEGAVNFAKKYGLSEDVCFTDMEEMAKFAMDVVYIATPNSFHVPYAKIFAKNKIHIISEKPISVSLAEVKELEEVARENGVYFFEAMRPVHHKNLVLFKEILKASKDIRYAYFNFMKYSSTYDKFKEGVITPRFDPKFNGGALNDLGVYPIYVAYFLFGVPLNKTINVTKLHNGIDAVCNLTLIYENFNVNIAVSKVSTSYLANEIQTETKTYLFDHITGLTNFIEIDVKEGKEQVLINEKIEDDMRFEARDFRRIILEKDDKSFNYYKELSMQVVECLEDLQKQMKSL